MQRNFKLIGGFGIAEKEINKRGKINSNGSIENKNDNTNPVINDIIDKYYKIGIREFFIGYNPDYWHNDYGFEFSPNGRFGENEQITSYNTFKQSIDYVHTLKTEDNQTCEIFLTVNGWYYSDITMPLVKRIIQDAINAGIDGFIVSNFEILEHLAEIGFKGKINISTIFSIFNEDGINFLIEYFQDKGLNLNRMILPREVTLFEIKRLCEMFPNLKFEVFGHGDYCRYSNGLCFAEHKYFSRDLCTFVLKHGMQVKKSIKYNYKTIIFDPDITNISKQEFIDNSLNSIDDIFISQNIVTTNSSDTLFDETIVLFQENLDKEKLLELSKTLYTKIKSELTTNFTKYIYDGLRPSNDLHNLYITKFLTLIGLIKNHIEFDDNTNKLLHKIQDYKSKGINYYTEQTKLKGKFGLETYYKFMLYNRTSAPFYKFFNSISNIEVVKIPLRGRDISVMKLGLDLIQDAIDNPNKYIDEGSLSGKYFHYDPEYIYDKYIN